MLAAVVLTWSCASSVLIGAACSETVTISVPVLTSSVIGTVTVAPLLTNA